MWGWGLGAEGGGELRSEIGFGWESGVERKNALIFVPTAGVKVRSIRLAHLLVPIQLGLSV